MADPRRGSRHRIPRLALAAALAEAAPDEVLTAVRETAAGEDQLLTELRGWTVQQYEDWLAGVIDRLLPGPDQPS